MCANPTTMFFAQCSWTSKNSPSSTTRWITSLMSYGRLDSAGTMLSSAASMRSAGSLLAPPRRILAIVLRQVGQQFADHAAALGVVAAMKWPTPLTELCVIDPPSVSLVTSSWVTVLITSGPVTNM